MYANATNKFFIQFCPRQGKIKKMINKGQRLSLRKALIRLKLDRRAFCPINSASLCFVGGTKKTSFSVGLNWRQGAFLFFFFPAYHQPINNPPKKHELHLVRLKPPLPLHSCFKLAVWGCDVRGMNGQNNYRYEGGILCLLFGLFVSGKSDYDGSNFPSR